MRGRERPCACSASGCGSTSRSGPSRRRRWLPVTSAVNRLPQVVQALRATIVDCGGEVHFGTRVTDLVLASGAVTGVVTAAGDHVAGRGVILATGHSARDVLMLLQRRGLALEAKPFAVGVRVEHPQALVDQIQYRCTTRPRGLPAASYALVRQVDGRGVFSFCMCPGGVICPAATSGDEVVVNGWSPSSRGLGFANAGMVVEVTPDDLAPHRTEGVLAGIAFQTASTPSVRCGARSSGVTSIDRKSTRLNYSISMISYSASC